MGSWSTLVELSINFVHYSTINRAPTRGTPSIPAFGGVLIIDIGALFIPPPIFTCRLVPDFSLLLPRRRWFFFVVFSFSDRGAWRLYTLSLKNRRTESGSWAV